MKLCPTCGQAVAQEITTCPACGGDVGAGRTHIDDYRIVEVLHEGHATLLCRAVREPSGEEVMIRLFTRRSGVNEEVAERLERELERLRQLPEREFVRHQAIRRSSDGLWYRVSEWIDAENWGTLLASGKLGDWRRKLDLFRRIAHALESLHSQGHIIPHLILSDIIVLRGDDRSPGVKIDYKLSRFIDPRMDRPPPMLERLLAVHPDIRNGRPLDARSDMWSLGKIFVEVLAGDLDIPSYQDAVDELPVADELKVLLRVMLSDDADLRPGSMAEVADHLERVGRSAPAAAARPGPVRAPSPAARTRRRVGRVGILTVGVVLVAITALLAWYLGRQRRDVESILEEYANRYVGSVAFVLVDYWLETDGEIVYRNASEGTAFLVDEQGHLLTSRHVACPWLEDGLLLQTAKQLLDQKRVPWLGHRIHLWFEGQKAFNRMGHFLDTPDVSDFFFTENAYGTDSPARLTVAGVALPPVHTRQLIASPLGDDIAVLRVDDPPDGLVPLPLDRSAAPHRIPRLSHVIALGFPLGSRTQEDTVNASAVDGHVRRSFANMLQIDSSLHGGNSGGPIIDARGKVIGIVAAVAVERSGGLFSTTRPLGDIGLILPITGAARLLAEVKAGGIKWNGVIDFTLDAKLRVVKEQALLGKWATARALAEGELERNPQAELLVACGVLALGNDDLEDARLRFEQLRSMDPRDGRARFLLYLVDWLSGDAEASPYRRELLEADWRSPLEFPGHLVRVLEGEIPIDPGLRAWQTRRERSWLHYVGGLLHHRAGRTTEAQTAFREAVLAGDFAGWGPQLARAGLEKLFRERRDRLRTPDEWSAYRDDLAAFREARDAALAALKAREEQLAPVLAELLEGRLDLRARLERLEKIRELDPEVPKASATLGFLHAADENWPRALECIREFLGREGRPTASRMTLGLIEAGILHHQGREDEAERVLESYGDTVRDGSYLGIAEHLLGRIDEETVTAEAAERPQDLLIAHTVLGFWAEGAGREAAAVTHYKEALGSFLDDWPEYDFARERIGRIRQATNDRD